jgi:FkbM family methyltransferase
MKLPPFYIRVQRRLIHRYREYPVLRLLYLLGLAALRLPPRGALTYWRLKIRPPAAPDTPCLIRLPKGRILRLRDSDTDLSIFEQIFLLDDCALPATRDPIRYILDAGAHVGCSSLFFADRHPLARILAVEAHAGNHAQLAANTAQVPAIQTLHGAVYHRNGPVGIANPGDRPWGFQVSDKPDGDAVLQGHTIPELMRLADFPRIDLLKLDIEGAERELFDHGGADWLRGVRIMIVEFHDEIQRGCTESFQRASAGIPHSTRERMDNLIWINHLHDQP